MKNKNLRNVKIFNIQDHVYTKKIEQRIIGRYGISKCARPNKNNAATHSESLRKL